MLLVTAAVAVAVLADLPAADEVRRRVAAAGPAAPLAFVGLYALVTLAPVPKNVLSAAAGALFGLVAGVALVWVAAMAGALLAFGLARALGRHAVERVTHARVREVDALLARRGLVAVLGVRLVPVLPFTALNYTAGLTGVRTHDYVVGTALGIVPGTVAYVALGTYATAPGSLPFALSVAALALLTVGGLVVARRRSAPVGGED